MSFTNQTTNLGLPQWQDTDEPTWLVDMNNAFAEIDKFAGNQDTKNDTVNAQIKDISDAQTIAGQNITKLQTDVSENTTQLTQLQAQQNINTRHISELQDKIDETNSTVTQLSDTVLQNNNTLTDSLEQQSAKLASLENTQQEQGTDIAGAKTDIQQNTSNIQDLQTNVNNLTTEVATNTTNIGTLQTDVQNITDLIPAGIKKVLLSNLIPLTASQTDSKFFTLTIPNLDDGIYVLYASFHTTNTSLLQDINVTPTNAIVISKSLQREYGNFPDCLGIIIFKPDVDNPDNVTTSFTIRYQYADNSGITQNREITVQISKCKCYRLQVNI